MERLIAARSCLATSKIVSSLCPCPHVSITHATLSIFRLSLPTKSSPFTHRFLECGTIPCERHIRLSSHLFRAAVGLGSRLLTYFDVIFADTRGPEWGASDAATLSAAAGQYCLEGSRVVTIGRKLVGQEGVWAFTLRDTLALSCGAEGYVWEVSRSAKSTKPDEKPTAEGDVLGKGKWVTIQGLQKAQELNGQEGVILEGDDEGVFTVMLDVSCQTLRVSGKNLQPLKEE